MRYELADYEWTATSPMLPNKPRGVPRANDRTRAKERQGPESVFYSGSKIHRLPSKRIRRNFLLMR